MVSPLLFGTTFRFVSRERFKREISNLNQETLEKTERFAYPDHFDMQNTIAHQDSVLSFAAKNCSIWSWFFRIGEKIFVDTFHVRPDLLPNNTELIKKTQALTMFWDNWTPTPNLQRHFFLLGGCQREEKSLAGMNCLRHIAHEHQIPSTIFWGRPDCTKLNHYQELDVWFDPQKDTVWVAVWDNVNQEQTAIRVEKLTPQAISEAFKVIEIAPKDTVEIPDQANTNQWQDITQELRNLHP